MELIESTTLDKESYETLFIETAVDNIVRAISKATADDFADNSLGA
jgi:hypothetical protein